MQTWTQSGVPINNAFLTDVFGGFEVYSGSVGFRSRSLQFEVQCGAEAGSTWSY